MAEKEKKKGISPAIIILPVAAGLGLAGVAIIAALAGAAPPGKAKLYGKVKDATTGGGIPGATITLDSMQVTANGSGNYSFDDLEPGSYSFSVEKGGYNSMSQDITLSEGQNQLNVALVPVGVPVASLSGVVTDGETNARLQGVKVSIDGLVTYTDSNGQYLFDGLNPGSYTVMFEKEGYETVTR